MKKVNKQPTELQKTSVNHASDKGLVSRKQKEFSQLKTKKINRPTKKRTKDLSRHFSTKDIQRAKTINYQGNAYQNHSETLLYNQQDGWNQKTGDSSMVSMWEKMESSYTTAKNIQWYSCFGKQAVFQISQKVKYTVTI